MNAVVALALAILVIGVTAAVRLQTDILPTFIDAVHAARIDRSRCDT